MFIRINYPDGTSMTFEHGTQDMRQTNPVLRDFASTGGDTIRDLAGAEPGLAKFGGVGANKPADPEKTLTETRAKRRIDLSPADVPANTKTKKGKR